MQKISDIVQSAMGERPFDLAVRGARLVNVFTEQIYEADIGITHGVFAYVGPFNAHHSAKQTIDGTGLYAAPGLIDSHMHIESSMMTPAAFAEAVLPLGTTTVAADPHEICNVLGPAGVKMMCDMSRGLPLAVHVMAPSTVPSAPGYETAGASIGGAEVAEMLGYPGVLGLGEVMDFLGVVARDPVMMEIIAAAKAAGVPLDGHVPTLRGKELQAFAATGIDCDHTYMDPELVAEKLQNGMYVQIQERFLTAELMTFLDEFPVQNRILLVTDDVPITRLSRHGHLGGVLRKAVALGLPPVKAIRYATINAADRMRLYNTGAIAPGRRADLLLLASLESMEVKTVFTGGRLIAQNGKITEPLELLPFPAAAYNTVKLPRLSAADFAIACADPGPVTINAIEQDAKTSRTRRARVNCEVRDGVIIPGGLVKMAVFERHSGNAGRSLGLLANMAGFSGALATTYAHDCHNLVVYSSNDTDAALAANTLIKLGGGVCAVQNGQVLCAVALPIAGILCGDKLPELAEKFEEFDRAVKRTGLNHAEPLTFITLMALAVSPEIKLTDKGLVDVLNKRFLPLIEADAPTNTRAEGM